jgi:peptidoglycan pentaglycine glycine transferase (the first glycine)
MWGVFRFKRGLGGQVARHIGAWDLPVRPGLFKIYTNILPRVLDFTRRRRAKGVKGEAKTAS